MFELSGPLDRLRHSNVVDFCKRQLSEGVRLEYKSSFSKKDAGKQIAKSISALANTQGGLLIYGVKEAPKKHKNEPSVPEKKQDGVDLGSNARDRVISASTSGIYPPVDIEISEFLADAKNPSLGFVVVRVPVTEYVHAVENGAIVYIRVADHSEPRNPKPDEYEFLLNRKKRGIDLQSSRRQEAIERIRRVFRPRGRVLWISVGPRILTQPIAVPPIRELASVVATYSTYLKVYCPVDVTQTFRSILDGVASYGPKANTIGQVDCFGNLTLMTKDLYPQNPLQTSDVSREQIPLHATHPLDVVITILRSAAKLVATTDYRGEVSFTIRMEEMNLVRLMAASPWEEGQCEFHDSIEFSEEIPSDDLADENNVLKAFLPIARRLIHAWGCPHDEWINGVCKTVEMMSYGTDQCTSNKNCLQDKPRNHPECMNCNSNRYRDLVPDWHSVC